MHLCHLIRKPGARSFVGKTLSWVLKLWYLEEAHIPPTKPKLKKFENFLKKCQLKRLHKPLYHAPFVTRKLSTNLIYNTHWNESPNVI